MAQGCIAIDIDEEDLAALEEAAERRGIAQDDLIADIVRRAAESIRSGGDPLQGD